MQALDNGRKEDNWISYEEAVSSSDLCSTEAEYDGARISTGTGDAIYETWANRTVVTILVRTTKADDTESGSDSTLTSTAYYAAAGNCRKAREPETTDTY